MSGIDRWLVGLGADTLVTKLDGKKPVVLSDNFRPSHQPSASLISSTTIISPFLSANSSSSVLSASTVALTYTSVSDGFKRFPNVSRSSTFSETTRLINPKSSALENVPLRFDFVVFCDCE